MHCDICGHRLADLGCPCPCHKTFMAAWQRLEAELIVLTERLKAEVRRLFR